MSIPTFDVAVIGGGIIGMSTAMALTGGGCRSLIVVEAEADLATHQSGRNSGVIHSGLYYKPGSSKARNCTAGREELYRFCEEHGIAYERCGKVIVATCEHERVVLDELQEKGIANGLRGLRKLSPEEIREREPYVRGIAGLLVPQTGIVDFKEVTQTFAEVVTKRGGEIRTRARVRQVHRHKTGLVLKTTRGEIGCKCLVNCGGLQADRIALMCGADPGIRIIPFRGEFYELVPARAHLVKHLVYPVPDPRLPFLGLHLTRTIHGSVKAGPNAVLAWGCQGYQRGRFSLREMLAMMAYSGFWRMAWRHWRTGLREYHRSRSERGLVRSLKRIIPELGPEDVRLAGAGIRAQAVEPNGRFVDDFRVIQTDRMIHVLNAPSPAATAAIRIGRHIAELLSARRGQNPIVTPH